MQRSSAGLPRQNKSGSQAVRPKLSAKNCRAVENTVSQDRHAQLIADTVGISTSSIKTTLSDIADDKSLCVMVSQMFGQKKN